jgi:hypothetical protein
MAALLFNTVPSEGERCNLAVLKDKGVDEIKL